MWYLVAVLGCWIFYIAYGEWLAWMILTFVLGLPWLSLALSLPAMVRLGLSPSGPDSIPLGQRGNLMILGSCPFPMPPFRGNLRLTGCMDGAKSTYQPDAGLTAAHCGGLVAAVEKARVYDYLGLFSLRVRKTSEKTILIRPEPLALEIPEDLRQYTARAWRPKFGGGFGENHELRLYRPGDSLNQVHWKLSAKTGKLILREPMEPERGLMLLTMTLRGTAEETDRKFGRLLWLGSHLLDRGLAFEIRALTGLGLQSFPVKEEQDLRKAVDSLLCTPMAREGSIRDHSFAASWQHHIGGDADEA